MSNPSSLELNQIVRALPAPERERLYPHLRLVPMPLCTVIYESGACLKQELVRHGQLRSLLSRYTQSLITQMAQSTVCNRYHALDQQLCRWLLLSVDRLDSNELKMTQELLASMLGVRREGVTEAASRLQKLGVIRYSQGKITVLDRLKLEKLSCERYAVVKKESGRLLGRD